uniref:flagellar hook-basal body protein n=1 Tax=Eubacterium cellulosolvens TaxID=29322 RepID=UPI0004847266|nr:flagellar hook-basal body protein [[Eubacterium] cellulosolvens]
MYQGFYELTSGIITQQRNLNTISNNMANVETAGYKKDTMTVRTFQEEMLLRTGQTAKKNPTDLAVTTPIAAADQTYTDYTQGSFDQTDGKYDFAIAGDGFFTIQTTGGLQYTRNGAFSVNAQGILCLDNIGTVVGADGGTIRITNENFVVDDYGRIISAAGDGTVYGQLRITGFEDTGTLHKEDNGMYTATGGQDLTGRTRVLNGYLEASNADMIEQMTAMISSQRALQSAAQMLKMYDQVLSKAASDVGRL